MIWKTKPTVDELNQRNQGTLATHLNMICTEVGDDYIKAELTLHSYHLQADGIMNGGVSCVFAETLASTASNYCVDRSKFRSVGLSLTTNHMRPVLKGILRAEAKPVHLGRTTQVWSILIKNEENKIISLTQFTLSVVEKKD